MSERELFAFFPFVFGGLLTLGGALFLLSLLLIQRRRRGGTYRGRRAAGERGGRLFVLSVILAAVGAISAVVWIVVGLIYRDALNPTVDRGPDDLYGIVLPPETIDALTAFAGSGTPTFTPGPTLPPVQTAAPPPIVTPTSTVTPNVAPTLTRTPLPTRTPSPVLTDTQSPSPTDLPLITNTPQPTLMPTRTRTGPDIS